MAMSQARKSLVTMFVLMLLAAGVGAFAYFGVFKVEEAKDKQSEETAKIFAFDKTKVKRVVLTAKNATTTIDKMGDEWRITNPIDARADKSVVQAIIDKLSDLKARDLNEKSKGKLPPEYLVADGEKELSKFGLDKPTFEVALKLEDNTEVKLLVGAEDSFDKSLDFKRGSDNKVYSADAALKNPFDKALFDLRDKSIVVQENKDVQSIAVEGNGEAWSAERDSDGWKLTAPVQEKGDKQTIEAVLTRVHNVKARSFPVEKLDKKDAAAYGLDKPSLEVVFTMASDRSHKTMQVGEIGDGATKKVWAHVGDGPVAEVDGNFIKDIVKSTGELRDRTIISTDREKITKIDVIPGEGDKFTVNRTKEKAAGATVEADAFTIEGKTDKVKTWKMSSALFALSNLKGATIVDEAGDDLARYALDKPQWTYVVYGEGGKEVARILIGALNGSKYYIKGSGGPRVFDIEKSTLDQLPKTMDEIIQTEAEAKAGPDAVSPSSMIPALQHGLPPGMTVPPGGGQPLGNAPGGAVPKHGAMIPPPWMKSATGTKK